ncbi:MAG: glycosyltransferase family 4 protein [Deltaproteobacteria bacterium]|nr:glycosyltransferase family 4 protein [Deltaproteobacteria bacterium]
MPRQILFIAKGFDDPSTRYRALQYDHLFAAHGWQLSCLVDRGSWLQRWAILQKARKADAVVIVRRTYSYPFLLLLRLVARHLVFDFDDAVFCKSNGGPSRRRYKGFIRTVSRCDQVWAGNNYLAAEARRCNQQVIVVPTSVFPASYEKSVEKKDKGLELVWIGSQSTRKHLLTIIPLLEDLAQTVSGLRLKIIADFTLQSDRLEVAAVAWSEAVEAQELLSADIGLAPLPDNAYTRGKCALKVLQYMAAELPVISSAVGVNKEVVVDGATGYVAENDWDWSQAVIRLAKKKSLRQTMGRAGREQFLQNFSAPLVFQKILASLERGLGGGAK